MRQLFFNIMGLGFIFYGFRAKAPAGEPAYFLLMAILTFAIAYHFRYRAINTRRGPIKTWILNKCKTEPVRCNEEKYPYLYDNYLGE